MVGAGATIVPLRSRVPRQRYEFVPVVATLALALVEIWAASFPGRDSNLELRAFLVGLPVAVAWLFVMVDRLVLWRTVGWPRIVFLAVSLPAIVVATTLVCATDEPLRARIAVSDTALRELAISDPETETVGLFEIADFSRAPFGFQFRSTTEGSCGLAFSPDGPPTQAFDAFAYEHLEGPWYTWCVRLVG